MTEYTGFEKAEVVSPRKQNVRNITKSGPGGSEHGTLNESKQQSKDGKVVTGVLPDVDNYECRTTPNPNTPMHS